MPNLAEAIHVRNLRCPIRFTPIARNCNTDITHIHSIVLLGWWILLLLSEHAKFSNSCISKVFAMSYHLNGLRKDYNNPTPATFNADLIKNDIPLEIANLA